jgi:Peptidase family M28
MAGMESRSRRGLPHRALRAACALALLVFAVRAQDVPPITAADLRADIELLASDAAGGRATGSAQAVACAQALAERFAAAGLQPAGDDGFLQRIDWAGFEFAAEPQLTLIAADGTRTPVARGPDFDYLGGPPVETTLQVAMATAAKDVPRAPSADTALFLVGGRRDAAKWLEAGGARDGAGWGAVLSPAPSSGPQRAPAMRGLLRVGTDGAPGTPPRLMVGGSARAALLAGQVARVEIAVRGGGLTPAVNVVGLLPGAGTPERPELAQQVVVITAHYDHLGTRAPPATPSAAPPAAGAEPAEAAAPAEPPDLIFNGADDDASGCAAVLALARVFGAEARAGRPPARSLIFLLVTGEERGLLGTDYWLDHPTRPLEQIVFNLNFEMIGRPDEKAGGHGRLWLTGFERSNVGPALAAAGLAVSPDARPEEHFFERSDNFAFVERGVVGQSLSSYNMHDEYHTVDDEIDTLDFAHLEAAVRASLAAARMVADGTITPEWVKGETDKKPGG